MHQLFFKSSWKSLKKDEKQFIKGGENIYERCFGR
jgi:hypothetical protein